MLTKAQSKYIRALSQQKYRKECNQFVAEGDKIAKEWLKSTQAIDMVVVTESWYFEHAELVQQHNEAELIIVKEHELAAMSSLSTAKDILLVLPQKPKKLDLKTLKGWSIALDRLQDPGNMGTIMRIADWFGIDNIVASPDCVDIYNPKVVQSAMGAHIRVNVYTEELSSFLDNVNRPIYAAVLNGENIHTVEKKGEGVILIGNESKGLDSVLIEKATHKITIPKLGGAESLNAGVSAGIVCALLTQA
ncbi:MAG: RNA methyltransferase [Flavipsychrobacter sp.]